MYDKIPPPSLFQACSYHCIRGTFWLLCHKKQCLIPPSPFSTALVAMEMSVLTSSSHFFSCLCPDTASPRTYHIPHFWCTALSWLYCIQTSSAHTVEGMKNCSSCFQTNTSTSLISQHQTTPDSWEERAHPQTDQQSSADTHLGAQFVTQKGVEEICSPLSIKGEKGRPPRLAMPPQ